MMPIPIEPIGKIHSPYQEKFAVPRQPGLVTAALATIELYSPYNHPDCVRGLAEFSHIWVLFQFHQTQAQGWRPLVRPPRLGGDHKKGVFASRSTFRPNNIGMSVVRVVEVEATSTGSRIHVAGGDWVNGTPVIDIKPYLPYSDSYPDALASYASEAPTTLLTTRFDDLAQQQVKQLEAHYPDLAILIEQVLNQDPRPAYQRHNSTRIYGVALYNLNVRWRVSGQENVVLSVS